MKPTLTEGAINKMLAGEHIDKPILQILGYKKIPNATDKFRFLTSDGTNCHPFCMLGTQLNSRLMNKEFEKLTVVRLDKYIVNQINPEKRVIILLEMSVIASGDVVGEKLGNPAHGGSGADSNLNDMGDQKPPTTGISTTCKPNANSYNDEQPVTRPYNNAQSGLSSNNTNSYNGVENPTTRPYSNAQPSVKPSLFGGDQHHASNSAPVNLHPINSLTPYQNRWTIRARVCNKSSIRTWSNSRGEGKLFSIELVDETGEIRATGFNEQVDKFYEMIEVNKVYYISKCTLKPANKKFTSIKNDYEMSLNSETTIIPCSENASAIPSLQFEFVPILEIQNVEKDSNIDVIGVCKSCSDVQNIVARQTGKDLKKRDVHLVDKTNHEVTLTLWETEAEKFDGSTNPIVAVKGARVSDYGGRSLSASNNSTIQINPDIREAHMLRGWYDREGATAQSQSLSVKGFAGGAAGGNTVWKTFAQAKVEQLGSGEKPDYYSSKSSVVLVRRENCLYMACPSEECNKKVVDMNNGRYRCEKCNQEYDKFKWRLLLNVCLCDFSDNLWVTCFQEAAETLLGVSAEELGGLKETDEDRFNEILSGVNFKAYVFRLRVKMEVYNEESRFRTSVVQANPVDPKEYGQKLLTDIKHMEQSL